MTAARPEMPPGVEDRNADLWEPLLAIADATGWGQEARAAAVELIGAARNEEPSLGIKLLTDLKALFDTSTLDALPTATILSRLIDLPESPWGDLKGKPINDRTLARKLKQYGVHSRDIRLRDRDTPLKGYAKEDLHDVWLRYLPSRDAVEARQARQALHPPGNGGLSQGNVADSPDHNRDNAATSATAPGNVADSNRDSSPSRDRNNSTESTARADVADVALVAGYEREGNPDPRDCGSLPDILNRSLRLSDRKPALGPEGDSLDDLK
jgi:hypothetical protein